MTGSVLIVDPIATNRIVLKVKLASAYYQVLQAPDVASAVAAASADNPDLIISALDLPDGGAAALARAIKGQPDTQNVPVMAIGCRPGSAARIAALEAGALDVMMKPIDDTLLLSRVRSLIRAYHASAEWRMREDTSAALGFAEPQTSFAPAGQCVLVGTDAVRAQAWMHQLRPLMQGGLRWSNPDDLMRTVKEVSPAQTFVLIQSDAVHDAAAGLRLISSLRANAATRHAGVLVLQTNRDPALGAQALDLGADDLMSDGFDADELTLRLKSLMQRKQMDAEMRATFRTGVNAALHDPLTGLHNRRYAMPHLTRIAQHAAQTGKPFAVMVADLDHFKQINDSFGHAGGDAVLVEVAARLRDALRASDLVARIGGEEFMIVMPGTTLADAQQVAVRICDGISGTPFDLPCKAGPISVTVSIGMAIGDVGMDGEADVADLGSQVLDQADKALYSAKMRGRNRVTLSRPAA